MNEFLNFITMVTMKGRKKFTSFCRIEWVRFKIAKTPLFQPNFLYALRQDKLCATSEKNWKKVQWSSLYLLPKCHHKNSYYSDCNLVSCYFLVHIKWYSATFHSIPSTIIILFSNFRFVGICLFFFWEKPKDIRIVYQTDLQSHLCFFDRRRNL